MTSNLKADFESALLSLRGKPCWKVQVGAVGSMASLHFGEQIPLDKPLPFPNPKLTPEEHKFRGEYILYVEDCPWRIDGSESVLATWLDSNAPDGPIVSHMRNFEGQVIEHIEIVFPGCDLAVHFQNGKVLRIFPDQNEDDDTDSYALDTQSRTYIVGPYSQLREP